MKSLDFGRYMLGSLVATAILAGCGGSQSPIGAPVAMPQSPAIASHGAHSGSWMLPGTSGQDLLYLSAGTGGSGFINVYSYPAGKLVGQLTGLLEPPGECVDSSGDVFAISYANTSFNSSTIYEYAHGGTSPIATLADPGVGMGCSVDPTTGNLAVGNSYNPYYKSQGSVAVFTAAQGTPKLYYSSSVPEFGACGFDDNGNLYLQGWLPSRQIGFAELPKSSDSIQTITLAKQIYTRGYWIPSVQWDGKHMTISSFPAKGSTGELLVHRLAFAGDHANVVGTTRLKSHKRVGYTGQTWIYGTSILGAEAGGNYGKVTYWDYPKGGKFTHMIKRATNLELGSPWGVTISPAQSP